MSFLDDIKKERINTIEGSVYFDKIIEGNIIKSINNKYVKVYKIEDIDYALSDPSGKESILHSYMNLFNNLDCEIGVSIILSCRENIDHFSVQKRSDGLDFLRDALNEAIDFNVYKGNKNKVIKKYLYLDITDNNEENAIKRFEVIDALIRSSFYAIGSCYLKEQTSNNIIKIMYLLYNPDKRIAYKENQALFDIDNINMLNLTIKKVIEPQSMTVMKKAIKFNDTYERCLFLQRTNKMLRATCLMQIITDAGTILGNMCDSTICIKIRQVDYDMAVKMVKRELGNVEGDIYNIQTKFSKRSINNDLVPRSYKQRREEALHIRDSLMKRDENLFNVSIYAAIRGDSLSEVSSNSYKFIKRAKSNGLTFITGIDMQEHIYNSIMPYGINQTPFSLVFDTESLRGFNIFYAVDVIEKDGDYYGKNKLTNNIIRYNIMHCDNYSQLILGMSGKGKSFIGKLQLITRMVRSDLREAVILDPQNEWRDVVTALGGKVVDVKSAGEISINLFDIDESYGDNPIADKEEFILSVVSLMLRKELTAGQRTTVSVAVNNIYKKWMNNRDDANVPTLEDFANELKQIIFYRNKFASENSTENVEIDNFINTQFNREGFVNNDDIEMLKAVMYYSETSNCKIFRGRSKVNMNDRIICFNLKDLGSDLKPLAMEVICDLIWLRICKSKKQRIPTDVIIDEFHLMFKDKSTSSWMAKYWKMLRKYLGCPIGITQNPEDVLLTEDGRNVINNTGFSILLPLLERDRTLVKEIWKLTNEEIKYIADQKRGEGIYIFGASKTIKKQTVIPFENEFRKDNDIYKIINTSFDNE